jgi:hypothetical protein
MAELFFVLFFFRSFATNLFILRCYVTLHIQHTQPLSDEKNEKNQIKDFFRRCILLYNGLLSTEIRINHQSFFLGVVASILIC